MKLGRCASWVSRFVTAGKTQSFRGPPAVFAEAPRVLAEVQATLLRVLLCTTRGRVLAPGKAAP
jgi:hypothetical protein